MINTTEIQTVKNRFGVIGNAPSLNYALGVAIRVAPTDLTVLINGESGSGKESFSKIIHGLSGRKLGPFIAINCGAIPEGTIDSELFGHIKGSFTGAIEDRKGYFETTNGGTIFLDEIAEMPLGTQARLLRILENGEYIPVGSSKVKKTNVRVVAATNVNLQTAIEKGEFREDLYYRLNTVPIMVPPLRERGFDIELLFIKFTSDFAEKNHIQPVELTEEAKELLRAFRFPGNIRQLKNIAEQITILEKDRIINAAMLEKYLPKSQSSGLPALLTNNDLGGLNNYTERELLYKVLFDMKKDITELKKLVYSMMSSGVEMSPEISNNELFKEVIEPNVNYSRPVTIENEPVYPVYAKPLSENLIHIDDYQKNRENVEDITHETEEESLSLEKNEKEMIVKALRKSNFKRKYAAQSLGISERTLYRKIKQYDIEDED
ncbi:MAG: sigma-54-dependent Fis family transcriptional regulator [Cytophagaceae bacterium]|nr:sigma-54-dependent Fis family transcriptional regulator [Cytophagaceae bacterium]MBK9511380.1 sigma-54-dependent Fis family transcriptional regulator [Cytophagaceae bacterium]MBK9932674.1 sigma-54-dependent Fis family transcriptional regulator [Cytophagaceae bacterium]MBL0303635.1 sigma-54-dependent Fis family transcriptional regulator [Cytophagaceae bacterium]MBL0326465.1 sigma-54-dependent Fis family transcriptional regulator [Cytophagaceae bacterium]